MEDQLKARLIGASVLVLLAVLLIPELLSARKPAADAIGSAKTSRGTRTYTINLGDAVSAGARLEPAPAAAKPLPATRAPAVEPTVEDSDPSPADEAATPAASPAANPAATATCDLTRVDCRGQHGAPETEARIGARAHAHGAGGEPCPGQGPVDRAGGRVQLGEECRQTDR